MKSPFSTPEKLNSGPCSYCYQDHPDERCRLPDKQKMIADNICPDCCIGLNDDWVCPSCDADWQAELDEI